MFIVQIAGHVGKDPETRFTPNGQKVTTFSIAVNQKKGKEEVTIWVRVTVWGDSLDKILSFIKKGSAVIVVGSMNPLSSYTDKEGRTQTSIEVTARMIEFSPFGRSDRPVDGSSTQTASSSSPAPFSYNQEGFSQEEFRYKQAPVEQSSQYGQGSHYASISEEDALPF